jgi:hypothetical protein
MNQDAGVDGSSGRDLAAATGDIRRLDGNRIQIRACYSLAMVDASATTRTPRPSIVSIRIATRLAPDK